MTMKRPQRWLLYLVVAGAMAAGGMVRAAAQRPDSSGGAPPAPGTIERGDLRVELQSAQRAARLIGAPLRSRENNHLVLKVRLRSPSGKKLWVHPRAALAVLSEPAAAGAPPVKYPVTLVGYFEPANARPGAPSPQAEAAPEGDPGLKKHPETIGVDQNGVTFSIAAEVPRSQSRFRLALQEPVAEAVLGPPRSLTEPVPVRALPGGGWEGQISRAATQQEIFRAVPGSSRSETLRPKRTTFLDLAVELRNAARQPQALTATDLVIAGADPAMLVTPVAELPATGRSASAIGPETAVAPQSPAEPLRPVWDIIRAGDYRLRVYGVAADTPVPAARLVSEMTVDTGEGHYQTAEEHRLAGRLEPATKEYQIVINDFPESDAAIDAKGRIADMEVAKILKDPFLPVPPPQQAGRGTAADALSNVVRLELTNGTAMPLTVYLSGATSRTVDVPPGETTKASVVKGDYKVGAKLPDPKVRPFAGSWNLPGGYVYQVTFIVVRSSQ
jgi:hypothetical protein